MFLKTNDGSRTVWVNSTLIRTLTESGPGETRIGFDGEHSLVVKHPAQQLADAINEAWHRK
jgi:hypothetical protein